MRRIAEKLLRVQEKVKPLFAAIALLLYVISLVLLAQEMKPKDDFSAFMVEALVRLTIPFSVILLQELKPSLCSPVRDDNDETPASVILLQEFKPSVCSPVRDDNDETPASVILLHSLKYRINLPLVPVCPKSARKHPKMPENARKR